MKLSDYAKQKGISYSPAQTIAMVTLGYAIANPTYNNYEFQGGFGLSVVIKCRLGRTK